MKTNDIFEKYDDATLRAFFPTFLKQHALEQSFEEEIQKHIAEKMKIGCEEGEPSAVVPANAQNKKAKEFGEGDVEGRLFWNKLPPIYIELRVPR